MSLHREPYRDTSDFRGTAILELALVVPILFLCCISTLELTRGLGEIQVASSLSRELGSLAFRECSNSQELLDAGPLVDPQSCAEQIVNGFRQTFREVSPNAQFVLSIYTFSAGVVSRRAYVQTADRLNSRYSPLGVFAPRGALERYEMLVIAEVFIPLTTVAEVPIIFTFRPENMYAVTIL